MNRGLLIETSVLLLLAVAAWTEPCFYARNCSTRTLHPKVDRPAVRDLQRAVDDGHQPWRVMAEPVAGLAVMKAAPELGLDDAFEIHFKTIRMSKTKAVLSYRSPSLKKSYQVTLRKFHWLLPLAKNWDAVIWTTTDVTATDCDH